MAENLLKRPQKGILKTSSSFEQQEAQRRAQDIKWDEMNILQTLHPPDKDYGHMKIEEPKTPYNYYKDELDGDVQSERQSEPLDLNLLAKKIEMGSDVLPKAMMDEESDSDDEIANETEEERAKRKLFEQKRKSHYNEFYAVKLARKLMQNDDDDDEDIDEDENNGNEEVKTESLSSETNEMAQDDPVIESKI